MLERFANWWCRNFHNSPMWPSHGYYRCSRCFRMHPVFWAVETAPEPSQMISRRASILSTQSSLERPVPSNCFGTR